MSTIESYTFDVRREPLVRPFGFKGGYFTEKWLVETTIHTDSGAEANGIGGLAVLWSAPELFFSRSEVGGNLLMASVAEEAVRMSTGRNTLNPVRLVEELIDPLWRYARTVTGIKSIPQTFVLNALVSLDTALWCMEAAVTGKGFDDLVTERYPQVLSERQSKLTRMPLIGFTTSESEVKDLLKAGAVVLKIKLGHPGNQTEMLEKDLARIETISRICRDYRTPHSASEEIMLYLDANGRYQTPEGVQRLADGIERMGVTDRVLVLEEPYPPESNESVASLPFRVAADESVHSPRDIEDRIALGYKAFALKPAGKTLSMTLEMASAAENSGCVLYVADSACTPRMVEWNKNVAARLPAFPELRIGAFESNGFQVYRSWERMMAAHPAVGAKWVVPDDEVFTLDGEYYERSGAVFETWS